MRVALMVTCINDAMFPETGKAVVTLLRRLGVDVGLPGGADLLCPAHGQHRLPRRGGADRAHLRRRVRGVRRHRHAVRLVCRIGPAPALIVAKRSGDAGLVKAVAETSPKTYELVRVPRRRPGRDRRQGVLPRTG